MPTKHPRINVTKDDELATALARVRALMGDSGEATIVHDLAIRGAQLVADQAAANVQAIDDLIEWSTGSDIDRDVLRDVDQFAWRQSRP